MATDKRASALYCQKCRTPLEVDASIDQLNPAAFKLLTDATAPSQQQASNRSVAPHPSRPTYPSTRQQTYDAALQSARNPTFKRSVPPQRISHHGTHHPAMSFVDIDMSESLLDSHPIASPTRHEPAVDASDLASRKGTTVALRRATMGPSLADGMETTSRMFEILSARSDIDHPICVECTELLVDGLQKRLGVATRERDAYVDYLRRANTDVPTAEEVEAAEAERKRAHQSEVAAIFQLQQLEADKAELDAQLATLEAEARQLGQVENQFWASRNAFSDKLSSFQNERDALTTKHAHDTQILTQLQRRSVYNDTFNITHDNHFATINGLRLGRLSSPHVDWPELNAAWGQTCLLLATLAERLGYKFQGYELCPMGSTSSILKLESKVVAEQRGTSNATTTTTRQRLELWSSGELPFHLGFMHRKFDTAMVAFLECLRQLGDFVENSPHGGIAGPGVSSGPSAPSVKMPYEIKKDKIHDQSIKISLSKDENWTKACKYTLTCCKYLLAHANNIENMGFRRTR